MKFRFPSIDRVKKDTKEILSKTISKAVEDDIMTQGAAIAFYTVFSIAPLFILIVSLSDLFLSEEYINQQIEMQLTALLGSDISSNLMIYLEEVTFSATGTFTTIIAIATLIFGATTVITQMKHALNIIWNVKSIEINSIWNFLLNRLLSFGIIILSTVLLVALLLMEAVIEIIIGFFSQALPEVDLNFYLIITEVSTIVFAIAFFALIFKILPDVIAPWRHILIGAVATTLLFLAGKYLIGAYLTSSGISAAYRAAGSLILFIVWVYYNIQTILLGAVFTQVYTEHFGGKILPYRFVKLE